MASELFKMVEHLFDAVKENVNGIHIKMQDNTISHIELNEQGGDVQITINNVLMGCFSPYLGQGYSACFFPSPPKITKYASADQIIMLKSACKGGNILYIE